VSDVVYFPTLADALTIYRRFTGHGVRDIGLLASALGRPQTSAFGQDAYPDLWSKAAALMHSVIRNHPFLDANKRTAVGLALTLLTYNGIDAESPNHETLLALAVGLANSDLEVPRITVVLQRAVESDEPFDPRELA
jgi:death-on-curing protein